MRKYNNEITTIDGIKFASRLEAERFQQLRLLEKAEEIEALQLQVEFQILTGWTNPDTGERTRSKYYVADFVYYDKQSGKWIIEDTKGVETSDFKLKWDFMKTLYRDFEFRKVTRKDI